VSTLKYVMCEWVSGDGLVFCGCAKSLLHTGP